VRTQTKAQESRKGEKAIIKDMGGKPHLASGALLGMKSDGHKADFQIEVKETDAKQISVRRRWIDRLRKEAAQEGRIPVWCVRIGDIKLVMMRYEDWNAEIGDIEFEEKEGDE